MTHIFNLVDDLKTCQTKIKHSLELMFQGVLFFRPFSEFSITRRKKFIMWDYVRLMLLHPTGKKLVL